MSSRFLISLASAAVCLLASCGEEGDEPSRMTAGGLPPASEEPTAPQITALLPADLEGAPLPADVADYAGNSDMVSAGSRYFGWYNCAGCHFRGAGGIGPAFMDHAWIYGGRIDQIYASIYDGRPNGMPAWGRVIPEAQIWQLAAYVKSLESDAPIPKEPVPGTIAREGGLDAHPRLVRKAED